MALDPVATGIASGFTFDRKSRLYYATITVWRKPKTKKGPQGQVPDEKWVQTITGVRAYRETNPNNNNPLIIGQSDIDNVFTLDICHVEQTVDIHPDDFLQFHAAGHHDDGQWFAVHGQTQVKNWKAGKQKFYIKLASDPRYVSAAVDVIDAIAEGTEAVDAQGQIIP